MAQGGIAIHSETQLQDKWWRPHENPHPLTVLPQQTQSIIKRIDFEALVVHRDWVGGFSHMKPKVATNLN